MAIYNLGSINVDHFYRVAHLPEPGETLDARDHKIGLGGKGANQSIAAALAGRDVYHIGGIGADSDWILDRLKAASVICDHITISDDSTGHAIINVDKTGENTIILYSGSNKTLNKVKVLNSLSQLSGKDSLLLQNETNLTEEIAMHGAEVGARVIYSAAPFDAAAVQNILPYAQILLLNEVEAEQFYHATAQNVQDSGVAHVVITKGAEGVDYWSSGEKTHVPAILATAVDTTGAGDCFAGFMAAGLDEGLSFVDAIRLGTAAASLKVEREGTSDVFPKRAEVNARLKEAD